MLDRCFTAPAPNKVWVADFTYCRTWAVWVYVAFVVTGRPRSNSLSLKNQGLGHLPRARFRLAGTDLSTPLRCRNLDERWR